MWYWEVLWEDSKGNVHSFFSLKGYERESIIVVYNACVDSINKQLLDMGAVKILDVQFVYRVEK